MHINSQPSLNQSHSYASETSFHQTVSAILTHFPHHFQASYFAFYDSSAINNGTKVKTGNKLYSNIYLLFKCFLNHEITNSN